MTTSPVFGKVYMGSQLTDAFARKFYYLRLSITDVCNFRCTYCLPKGFKGFEEPAHWLRHEEMSRLVGLFVGLGVSKVRLTGGEPLVRRGIVELVQAIHEVPGIECVVMTTNGVLLSELAEPLIAAGLDGVNISLDTLRPEVFADITRRPVLEKVCEGIRVLQAQGMKDVMVLWDCTQAEAAKRLGMAQPTLANKLRLLQLTTDQRQFVLDNGLTERHARAVLRLPENRRSEALITIAKRRMNARQTDLYIEQVLNAAAPGRHRISMVKDVRIFVNTIDHAIRLMTDNGVPATAHREERDGYIEYTVRIPTAAAQR